MKNVERLEWKKLHTYNIPDQGSWFKAAYIYYSIVQACKTLHLLQAEETEDKALPRSYLSLIELLSLH